MQEGQCAASVELPAGTFACKAHEAGAVTPVATEFPGDALYPRFNGGTEDALAVR